MSKHDYDPKDLKADFESFCERHSFVIRTNKNETGSFQLDYEMPLGWVIKCLTATGYPQLAMGCTSGNTLASLGRLLVVDDAGLIKMLRTKEKESFE